MYILRISLLLCLSISASVGQVLPDISTFIVNGTRADVGQFPYLVSIRFGGEHNCGGAIIDKRWILTAAHCATEEFDLDLLTVVAGIDRLDQTGELYSVKVKVPHRAYNKKKNENDIGLLKLDRDINFENNDLVTQIPLALENENIVKDGLITTAGWGFTEYPNSQASNELYFVKLNAVDKPNCQKFWNPGQVITNQHLCAKSSERRGTCLGDSGGPYVHNNRVVGVHILGDWCKLEKPSVAVRVSEYLDWIRESKNAFP